MIHDPNLKRLARDSRSLAHLDYAELATLDVGSWFGAEFRDQRVLTLEQVLDFFAGVSRIVELQVEIKDGKNLIRGSNGGYWKLCAIVRRGTAESSFQALIMPRSGAFAN